MTMANTSVYDRNVNHFVDGPTGQYIQIVLNIIDLNKMNF